MQRLLSSSFLTLPYRILTTEPMGKLLQSSGHGVPGSKGWGLDFRLCRGP